MRHTSLSQTGWQALPRLSQQTLQNTIKWSYDLLDDNEQTLFRHLAIFVGGSSLAAAEEICTALADTNVLAGISSLLDKSLLQQVAQEENEPRIQLLETIREFGLDCLVDAGEAQTAQKAHPLYFLNFACEICYTVGRNKQETIDYAKYDR